MPTFRSRARDLLRADIRLTGLLGLLFVVAIWAVARPYRGLRHDAILYAAQTVRHAYPERFQSDVFFMFGSQDQFSAFSPLFTRVVQAFGLGNAEIIGLIACQLLFIVAAWKMAGHFTRGTRWLAVLCIVVFPHTYASHNIFGFAENFLTARSIAEPLALFGLVAWSSRKRVLGGALFLVAAAMHPLIAFPALVVAWIMQIRIDRRWIWLAGLALPAFALAKAGVAPFDSLMVRYDADWWAQVHFITPQVLMSSWERLDWLSLGTDVTILWMASRCDNGRLRELTLSAIGALAALCAVSMIGVDVLRDVLLTSLQLWRVLWIGHLIALMCLPQVVLSYWQSGNAGRLVSVATVGALLSVGANIEQSWILLLWLGATLYLQRHAAQVSTSTYRMAIAATVATMAVITFVSVMGTYRLVSGDGEAARSALPLLAVFSLPIPAILLSVVLLIILRRCPTPVAVFVLCVVFAGGASHWDQRSAWQRYVESGQNRTHPFESVIPPTALVFWSDGFDASWFMLKRGNYVSQAQGAGVAFNQRTAIEFQKRMAVMQPFEIQKGLCKTIGEFTGGTAEDFAKCTPTPDILEGICHAQTHPDFMIFSSKLAKGLVDTWTFDPPDRVARQTYYLYDCSRI